MTGTREAFLQSSFLERLKLASDPVHELELRTWLGEQTLTEYQEMACRTGQRHLSDGPSPNLMFVPGVMGSMLASTGLGGIWWLDVRARKHINNLRLAADGVTDADARAQIVPVAVDLSYDRFLASVFTTRNYRPISFPYDWRKPLETSAGAFATTIRQASENNGGKPIHLVAHSMGGLLVRTALMIHPELWKLIGKVVFIGTPHYGSPAIAGYLKNHLWGRSLLVLLARYIDRATFRSLRGVLSLLPAPAGIYPATRTPGSPHPCGNYEMYDAHAWRLQLTDEERHDLQASLDSVATTHGRLFAAHQNLDQSLRDRMLVIAGVGYKTLFQLGYKPGFGFRWEHMDRVTARKPGDPHREGDGRVPLASAMLESVGETRFARGKHDKLPGIAEVSADVFHFLDGQPLQLARTPRIALQAHLGAGDGGSDDPGYLDFIGFPDEHIDELETKLDSDQLPSFNRISIL